jgi:hypothetical protein
MKHVVGPRIEALIVTASAEDTTKKSAVAMSNGAVTRAAELDEIMEFLLPRIALYS